MYYSSNPFYLYQAAIDATGAKGKADRAEMEIHHVLRALDKLALASQAMWELLRESPGFTEDNLRAKMQEIDLRDGTADGRMSPVIVDCPACGAKANTRRGTCLMCGAPLEKQHTFQA